MRIPQLVTYNANQTLYAVGEPEIIQKTLTPGHAHSHGAPSQPVELTSIRIPAIWTSRKSGTVQVSKGILGGYHRSSQGPLPGLLEELMALCTHGGGVPAARWDGVYMWAPKTPLTEMVELAKELDPILEAIPEVPAGYQGWYKL